MQDKGSNILAIGFVFFKKCTTFDNNSRALYSKENIKKYQNK